MLGNEKKSVRVQTKIERLHTEIKHQNEQNFLIATLKDHNKEVHSEFTEERLFPNKYEKVAQYQLLKKKNQNINAFCPFL